MKLLVKYAVELKEELQTGLAQTPTQPWKDIIPQLFCRLNHTEAYVRQSISELLCRIARDLPHLIIYPAVVGTQDGPTKIENVHKSNDKDLFDKSKQADKSNTAHTQLEGTESRLIVDEHLDDSGDHQRDAEQSTGLSNNVESSGDEEEDDEEAVNEEKKVELKNSYKYLMDTLAETNPKMIEQVKLFVHEMRRITLLREELWIGTLNQIRKLTFT